jgi:hypothetical protein
MTMLGENNTEFGKVVHEYLSRFSYYKVRKEWALKQELYAWCQDNLGQQYKDWFVHEGGKQDKWWTVNIRSPKHGTLFALRWNDIIIESVDRRKS